MPKYSEEEKQSTIDNLKNLQTHPGWSIVIEAAEENIEYLKNYVVKDPNNASKEQLDALRKKIEAYEDVINSPKNIIKKLTASSKMGDVEFDPYYTEDDFKSLEEKAKEQNS